MSHSTMSAPSPANARAWDSPWPRAPPVISTVLPLKRVTVTAPFRLRETHRAMTSLRPVITTRTVDCIPSRTECGFPAKDRLPAGCEVDPVGRLAPADKDRGHHLRREQAVRDDPGRR